MQYKITLANQIRALSGLLLATVIMLIVVFFIIQSDGYSDGITVIFGIGYLVIFIPTLFLHIEYFMKNRNDILFIDELNKEITINHKKPLHFNEIKSIIYVMPPVWHRKGIVKLLPFEDYHFAKINMENGESFIFTCLMAYRVEDALMHIYGVNTEKRKLIIATTLIEVPVFLS